MSALKEAVNLQKRQVIRLKDMQNTILCKLSERINTLSKNGQLKFIYNVPYFLFGFPIYNIEDLTLFILQSLIKEGYCAIKVDESKIFISWDINDINNFNIKKRAKEKSLKSLLPIINIK